MSQHTDNALAGYRAAAAALVACATLAASGAARGQALQFTEILSNPISANDDAWEWIEVRNTGATPLDLNGYIFDRLGDATEPTVMPSIIAGEAMNTVIPAGGVAVLYDADVAVAAADFNDAMFRTAWGLAPTVPLIGVSRNFGGGLTNDGGTAIGLWPDATAYNLDVADDGLGVIRVAQFNNASASLDFTTAGGFPAGGNGVSNAWNGTGSYQTATSWAPTSTGTTSIAVTVPGATNSDQDVGNPGTTPGGTPPTGLLVTEIMYNPRTAAVGSVEQWEWVEIYNGGPAINFATTPYVFHNLATTADLTAENITSGSLATGAKAILFNDAISLSSISAAWDPGGALGTQFIPVSDFPALGNNGGTIGIWDSLADYQTDSVATPRVATNAVLAQPYDDEVANIAGVTGTWPTDDGNGSISLVSLDADRLDGASWALSAASDGRGSVNAVALNGTITVHPGGDLGTPGVFVVGPPPANNSDFDNDGDVDGADFLTWQKNLGATGQPDKSTGDANGDGNVNAADLTEWQAHFGLAPAVGAAGAVPEPSALALAACVVAGLTARRRRG
jgi:hypothetical protein